MRIQHIVHENTQPLLKIRLPGHHQINAFILLPVNHACPQCTDDYRRLIELLIDRWVKRKR